MPAVRYKLLGRTGCRVSEACLGTMVFGEHRDAWGNSDERQIQGMFDAFAEAGGNFVDTSDAYTDGTSEEAVGRTIASDRDHWVVATKYSSSFAGDVSKAGNSRKHMMAAVEASLRRLGTDRIDVYFVHVWDGLTPIEEILRGLDDLVRQGKVVYVGLSNTPAWVCGRASAIADLRGWAPIVSIQVPYSLVERGIERELLPMAAALDLAVMAYAPLGGGVLSGKYLDANGDGRYAGAQPDARTLAIAREVVAIAGELGTSPTQVALSWLRSRHPLVLPILGARRLEQLEETLRGFEAPATLDPTHEERLDAVSAIDRGYPAERMDRDKIRGVVTGDAWERLALHRPAVGPSPLDRLGPGRD